MKIHLKLEGRVIPATLADGDAARAFAAMLPLTITMHDLFGREKFGALPGPVSRADTRTRDCEPGDILCWSAGPDLAVFHWPERWPVTGGFHVLGKIDAGAEAFGVPGPLDVTIELATLGASACLSKPFRSKAHTQPVIHLTSGRHTLE